MTEGAWLGEERSREALPRLEDLPLADRGYDRDAVRAAFEAFYRHAAELDSTLRTLEAVEAFQRQAGELRADIRALRAAAWGPVPAVRGEPWYAGYGRRRRPAGPAAAVSDALPRVAVETAFIIAVAVGAGIANLATPLVVAVIGAALLVVAAIEVVASFAEPRRARRARVVAAPPEAAPEERPVAEPAAADAAVPRGEEEARPVEAAAGSHVGVVREHQPEVRSEEPAGDETQADLAPAGEAAIAAEPEPAVLDAEPEPVAPEPARDEELEPAAAAYPTAEASPADPWERGPELVPVPAAPSGEEDTPRPSRLRFWRRHRAAEREEPPAFVRPSGHVEVIEVRPAAGTDDSAAAEEPVAPASEVAPPPAATAAPPERAGLRRGRR